MSQSKERNLNAPIRHPIDWHNPEYYQEASLFQELERVFDLCHGCRRCVNLCQSFPTLFDLVDESDTMEVDGVDKKDYWQVVDHCYLCDLCYMTKCPYTPPHEWNIDFPHLMLRAKAVKYKQGKTKTRDKLLTNTDLIGKIGSIPVVAQTINTTNNNVIARKAMHKLAGIHTQARLPVFHHQTAKKQLSGVLSENIQTQSCGRTHGKVILFSTCYGNVNAPQLVKDLVAVLEHNHIRVRMLDTERCCGMPKLELGDLHSVKKAKENNIPLLLEWVNNGWDIVTPIPSCTLMFKNELPLLFAEDEAVKKVSEAIFDPFEYLVIRHKHQNMNTDFKQPLGKVAYHVACHQRVQNIGQKTREILSLIPDTEIKVIERCSGHDGTYAVKREFHQVSMKIARPVIRQVKNFAADYYGSDCVMAGEHIANALDDGTQPQHPISLLRQAYQI